MTYYPAALPLQMHTTGVIPKRNRARAWNFRQPRCCVCQTDGAAMPQKDMGDNGTISIAPLESVVGISKVRMTVWLELRQKILRCFHSPGSRDQDPARSAFG